MNTTIEVSSSFPSISPSTSVVVSGGTQFFMTKSGIILTTVTGILSTVCSLLILNAIRLSNQKLTTTYHRMMSIMSVFDIMASVCMALTTLPMPSDDILKFPWPMIGNKVTCQAQGYIILFGLNGGGALYMCLSWYFVFRMTLKMDIYKIRNRIEPVFYVISLALAFFVPSYRLSADFINTVPTNPFCIVAPPHTNCTYTVGASFYVCEDRTAVRLKDFPGFKFLSFGFDMIMIVIAMLIIIATILIKNKNIRRATDDHQLNSEHKELQVAELRHSRVLLIQAFMYILTYFTTWLFTVIPMLAQLDRGDMNVLQVFKLIFFPLQGFWNLIIFLYDKAYLAGRGEGNDGIWKTIKTVLFHPARVPDIVLPSAFMIQSDENEINESQIIDQSEKDFETQIMHHDHSSKSLEGSPSDRISSNIQKSQPSIGSIISSDQSSTEVIKHDGIDYVGNDNLRFYLDSSGLRRTGKVEDRREGRAGVHSTVSIESPSGLIGDDSVNFSIPSVNDTYLDFDETK
jgi:hypothetical protein